MAFKAALNNLCRRQFLRGLIGFFGALFAFSSPRKTSALASGEKMIGRTHADYEALRKGLVWQRVKPARRPEVIVQANSVDAVVNAVNHARNHGLKVIAKSGGHSIPASFLRNDGMLIDLLGLREVTVNRDNLTATAGPGTWGPTLLQALEAHDMGFPVARGGSVSIGGFLLGGGLGFNPNTWGIACFSVIGADVVTATGEMLTVNARQHPDIYWAVRGAGPGFFGVVTQYYLRAYPLPGAITTSQYIHPLDNHAEVAAALEELVPNSDHRLELILLLTGNPDQQAVAAGAPEQVCIVNVVAYGTDEADARALLEPVANSGLGRKPLQKTEYEPSDLKILTGATGESFPHGRMATEGVWSNSIAPVIATLSERLRQAVTPVTTVSIRFIGNTRLPEDAAFSLIGSTNILSVLTWQDASDDNRVAGWLRDTMAALEPFSLGHYINNEDVVSYPERNQHSFTPDSWSRLRALRRQYDPDNLFHDYFGTGTAEN